MKMKNKEDGHLNASPRDRERKVVEIFRNFLLTIRTFRRQEEKYRRTGSLEFADLAKLVDDRGQSILFALKESCHSLFRRIEGHVSEKEQIFDLTAGTLFHLAMKMREDLYQLEFYGPKYSALNEKIDGPPERGVLIRQFHDLISRARKSFQESMGEMGTLFQKVLPQFQELLREHKGNGLLIRFLLEEQDLLHEIWGDRAVEDLFETIYGPRHFLPYRLAGESYFQSGFYGQAVQAFSQALQKDPKDEDLLFIYQLSQAMEQFYSFAPQQSLKCLEKCLSCSAEKETLENYRGTIYKVCEKIQEQFPGRRKSDQHPEWGKKARAIQRQFEKLCPVSQEGRTNEG
jgi:tetratricopeptide (TPR) repeat protein